MKKLITLAIILITSTTYIKAQGYNVAIKWEILSKLKQRGITVVIPENKFGKILKETIITHWKASKFEFISEKELANYSDGKEVFLFGLFNGEVESAKHYLKNVPFIGIVSKYNKKNNYTTKTKACVSIVYPGDGISDENLESTILLYVKIMQNLVNSGGAKNHMTEAKKNGKNARKKPAYVNKDYFKASTTDIKKKYDGRIKKVEREIYNQTIMNNEDVLISLDVMASTYHLFAIVDNKTGLIYSYMFTSTITPKTAASIQKFTFNRLGKL
jgi:hypothetical protein